MNNLSSRQSLLGRGPGFRTAVSTRVGVYWLLVMAMIAGPVPWLSPTKAQNPFDLADPFQGGSVDPFATAPGSRTPATDSEAATAASHPVAMAIARQDLTQPAKRVAAAETLFLLGYPEQAKQVLADLPAPLEGQAAYDLVLAVTSSRLLWIQSQAELPAEAMNWFQTTLANAMQYARSDESVNQALDQWLSGTAAQRAAAAERLQAAGLTAATAVLTRMQSWIEAGDLRASDLRPLVQVVQAGSADWDGALRSATGEQAPLESAAILGLAARTANALNQAVVLEWTLRNPPTLPDPALAPVLAFWQTQMLNIHGVDVNQIDLVRRWLEGLNRQQLAEWNRLRDPQYLLPSPGTDQPGWQGPRQMVWLWDAAAGGLAPQLIDPWETATRDHVALATAWLRADPANAAALQNYVIAQFQRTKLLTGVDEPLPPAVIDVAAQYLSATEMSEMLQQSLERQQWLVAQSLLESLAQVGDRELLQSTAGRPAAVVNALQAADLRVRWAATQTILAWQPQQGFVGSSYFNRTLRELLGSPTGSDVIVASMNPYHAEYLAALTRTVGHDVVVTRDAGQLFSEFSTHSPAFLIVTDSLGEVPYLAVIDKIRSSPKGQTIPILLLVRPENLVSATKMLAIDRRDPRTMVGQFSEVGRDLLPWIEQISRLQAVGAPPQRVAVEQVQRALVFLNLWGADEKARQLLDYAQLAPAAQSLLGWSPPMDPAILELLANYGNPETQWNLANLAGDTGRPGTSRVAAATAFRASVKRFGTLLTSQQIAAQYERQNRSGGDAQLTQSLLNSILDTLEARFRQTPFEALPPIAVSQDH
jgi:hypothetical protein